MRWDPDRFIVGTNLPWLTYGGDFGANAWHPDGGVGRPAERARLRDALSPLPGLGLSAVRWFMLCDGRAGIRQADDGTPLGPDEFVFRDADAAVEELERAGLQAIFVLFDFHFFHTARLVNGVQLGGRGALAADRALRAILLDRVVGPILDRYGRAESILAWDIINEPEWVTRGLCRAQRGTAVTRADMRAFIGDTCALIRERTRQAATVGSASTRWLSLVEGLGLDVYQAHWYDQVDPRAPFDRAVDALSLDRPILLGEFPTRGSSRPPADILTAAARNGYAGALGWSMLSGDGVSDHACFAEAAAAFSGPTPARP